MNTIGFMCKLTKGKSPKLYFNDYRYYRLIGLNETLNKNGFDLFIYSPMHINFDDHTVEGYIIRDKSFVQETRKIPKVTGNWYSRFSKNIEIKSKNIILKDWYASNGYHVYPSFEVVFSARDKKYTYEIVSQHNMAEMPYTEMFNATTDQMKQMLNRSELIYLKPRYGVKGNGIYVISKTGKGYKITYHKHYQITVEYVSTIDSLLAFIKTSQKSDEYLIQESVDVQLYNESPFIIRTVMVNDSSEWHLLSEACIAKKNSFVANTLQGSFDMTFADFVYDLVGLEQANDIIFNVHNTAYTLTEQLDDHYKGNLFEIAYDFTLDKHNKLFLIEYNAQPGLNRPGLKKNDIKDFFNITYAEKPMFDLYIKPYGEYLANYLLSKHHENNTV